MNLAPIRGRFKSMDDDTKTERIGRFEVPAARTRTGRPALPQQLRESDSAYAKRLKAREKSRRYREANPTYFRDWHRSAVAKGTVKRQRGSPEAEKAKRDRGYARKRTWVDARKDVPCADCGERFPTECMDFDHLPGFEKCFQITQMMSMSQARLKAEIDKCELVCACCHRIRSWRIRMHTTKDCGVDTPNSIRQARANTKRRALLDKIQDVPCAGCGKRFDPCCMDFDHRPGTAKRFNIGINRRRAWRVVKAEIAKCDIVCANCHRIRTVARKRAN